MSAFGFKKNDGRGSASARHLAIASSAGVLVLPAVAVATAQRDTVRGSGVRTVFGERFHVQVDAESGPTGEGARGRFFIQSPPGESEVLSSVSGRVTCLRVEGNRALVGGEVERSEGGVLEPLHPRGSGVLIEVVDNGEVRDGNDVEPTPIPPSICPSPAFPESELERGNYRVHDAASGR